MRRSTTIAEVKLTPHWLSGYVGKVNGRRYWFRQVKGQWRASRLGSLGGWFRISDRAKTLTDLVLTVKSR